MNAASRRFVRLLVLAIGISPLDLTATRADDAADRRAEQEGAAAMRRVVALWNGGLRDSAWFLYQDATRTLNADLKLLRPRNMQLAELRRFAAETIGVQPAPAADNQDRRRHRALADWPMWGGSPARNNAVHRGEGPSDWAPGDFDRRTGAWLQATARNVKWVAPLGSQCYTSPVVAGGKVFIGTNNSHGYLQRRPADVDLGCLLALRATDGSLLWQHSSEKLTTGRVHDWPLQGICSSPLVEGRRLWFCTNRGEVRCLDTEGFYDGVDDGLPAAAEPARLFDIRTPRPPLVDRLSAFEEALEAGRLPAELRPRFSEAGIELPEEVRLKIAPGDAQPERRWHLQAAFGHTTRDFLITHNGRQLSAFKIVTPDDREEADVVWVFDMMKELGVSPHNMTVCSPADYGDVLFICTANGVDEAHLKVAAPQAPTFIALDKHSGKVLWTDNRASANTHHANWCSPAIGVFAGVPQVIFGGGDGWIYSYRADRWENGKPILLWQFDTNAKDALLELGGRSARSEPIAFPVVYDGLVYVTIGQDPEHGEGQGGLWCIDPTRRGDISPVLVVRRDDPKTPVPHRRIQALDATAGEVASDNPNSAVVWHFTRQDRDGDGQFDFEEVFHRSISSVAVKDDVLIAADFSGLVTCLHAKTGRLLWTCDMLAAVWGSPLIVGDRVYVGDEDGDVALFRLHPDPEQSTRWVPSDQPPSLGGREPREEINMGNSMYGTPVFAGGVLYIAVKDRLFAIAAPDYPRER